MSLFPPDYPAQAGYFVCDGDPLRVAMPDALTIARQVLDAHGVRSSSVCIGLSGGLDSVVLLHVMGQCANAFDLRISAVHVNHGLHPRAVHWAEFCRDLCAGLGVPLTIEQVSIDRNSGLGTEAAAREQRYTVFSRINADYLVLAHHLDDQVETFLLQLLRGAGSRGLSAMPVERALTDQGPRLLRPFLTLSRSDLAAFAASLDLKWIEDESNADLTFDRNFLRHELLPLIEQRFPAYRSTLSRASRNLVDAAELTEILGRQDLEKVRIDDGVRLDMVRSWPHSRLLNTLRCLFRKLGYAAPARKVLTEAVRQAFEARQDARVRVDFGDFSLRRYRGGLYIVNNLGLPADWRAEWSGQSMVALPPGLGELRFQRARGTGLSAAALQQHHVRVALRSGGERIALAANRPHRDLRKLYQEAGVAPWLRERTPLLLCGSRLAFVPGLGIAAEFQAAAGEDSWDVEWVKVSPKAGEESSGICGQP